MNNKLKHILELEEKLQYEDAFIQYKTLYSENSMDYDIWKYFYFFLWSMIEEGSLEFQTQINLNQILKDSLIEGKLNFSNLADFNFIAGYTISIFPYEFGDDYNYEELVSWSDPLKLSTL